MRVRGGSMGLIDRVALSFYALLLTVVSFVFLLAAFGWGVPLGYLVDDVLGAPGGRTAAGIISGLLFVAGLRFVYFGFRRPPVQAVLHDTGMGEVRISLVAVKNLVTRVADKTPGVREVRTRVRLSDSGGVHVHLDVKVALDTNMPELADKMQRAVASYVKEIVGVEVESVRVCVSDIATEGRR